MCIYIYIYIVYRYEETSGSASRSAKAIAMESGVHKGGFSKGGLAIILE